jgi:hypothetical protein
VTSVGSKLPAIPFGAGIALWTACAIAFCVAGEMHQAWTWLAWLPTGVVLCMAAGRHAALTHAKRSCRAEGARAALGPAYPAETEERERLVRTGELDRLYRELDTAEELKIAVGSMTGCPPSEIYRFLVLAMDREGRLNVATSCCKHETDYMLHEAYAQLTGSEK